MNEHDVKLIVEALLMSSTRPLTPEKMQTVFEDWQKPSLEQLKLALSQLSADYQDRAIELKQVSGAYRIQTRVKFSHWIEALFKEKPTKYSRALLETLAIIAYKQPITRGEIENIRGVAVSSAIIRTLLEREWVRVAGYRDVPGKPAVYTTTPLFLAYFNLQSLDELPQLVDETVEAQVDV